jgi:transcriptional regulator with XRE-family HTH domain
LDYIGDRLKQLRKALHITQVEMGKVIGISGSGVSQVEAGASRLTEAAIKLICQTYHVSYIWLTTGDGPMLEPESPEMMVERMMAGESPLAVSVMKAFAALPIDEWRRLRNMIDQIKGEGQQ